MSPESPERLKLSLQLPFSAAMAENERALSARVLELEGALSAQHEAMESLRWARAQLERALQKASRERDEARETVTELQRALELRAAAPTSTIAARDAQPTLRLLVPALPAVPYQNSVPTVPAPPRERAPSVEDAERRERAVSGTYSVLDVSVERVVARRRRRIAR